MLQKIVEAYDAFEAWWESKQSHSMQSNMLVAVFTVSLVIGAGNYFHLFDSVHLLSEINFTDAIEFSFNFLLFFEMVGLAFVIPQSIANSIGKQFQIMSLIFLRTSFEELSNLSFADPLQDQFAIISRMAVDAGAAGVIFLLTVFYYRLQKHRQIADESERIKFINLKKIVAIGVLTGLVSFVFLDIGRYVQSGVFSPSYSTFYLILIYADMLLMLSVFRYVRHYFNIFRYSAFVLITIFIRIALTAPVYFNAIVGIGTVLFGIAVAYIHNLFLDDRLGADVNAL